MKTDKIILLSLLGFVVVSLILTRKKIEEMIWDSISLSRIKTLHPAIQKQAISFIQEAEKAGIKLRVTSALRTFDEQQALYNKGRTTAGRVETNAKAGYSYHNFGLAFDVVEIKGGKTLWNNPNWSKIGALGEKYGFEWGGKWKFVDKPHFQKSFGLSTAALRSKYNGSYPINLA